MSQNKISDDFQTILAERLALNETKNITKSNIFTTIDPLLENIIQMNSNGGLGFKEQLEVINDTLSMQGIDAKLDILSFEILLYILLPIMQKNDHISLTAMFEDMAEKKTDFLISTCALENMPTPTDDNLTTTSALSSQTVSIPVATKKEYQSFFKLSQNDEKVLQLITYLERQFVQKDFNKEAVIADARFEELFEASKKTIELDGAIGYCSDFVRLLFQSQYKHITIVK